MPYLLALASAGAGETFGRMKAYTVDARGHPRFKLEVDICKRRDRTEEREERCQT
jgi:hypothetical protein